ncbi:hypothetical protein O181_124744, partial [Austropuccinia psidii MF-1]|nr:hypothetical protein [Austropuccinia psidii MF-1]
MSELPEKIPLIILDSSESPSLFVTHHTKYMVELPLFPNFEWDSIVIDTAKGEDLIVGCAFFNNFNPSIDWRQGLMSQGLFKVKRAWHSVNWDSLMEGSGY